MHSARTRTLALAAAAVSATALAAAAPAAAAPRHHRTAFHEVDLVSDQPGRAALTDPHLINAWGMSHGPDTPLWVSANGADVSTLYTATGTTPAAVPLVVSIPGGAPTGQVYNPTAGFPVPGTHRPAMFVFASESGDLTAWNQATVPRTSAVRVAHVPGAVFKGLALARTRFGALLLATDFHHGTVDVFDASFRLLRTRHLFRDPTLPPGYAPFGIAAVGNRVVVTYAQQDAQRHDDVAGPGHGFVDVYSALGARVGRLASGGALDSPWGLLIAPHTFGRFAGDLLVGNFGDGRIHAYDPRTGHLDGTLRDAAHRPIVIDGLWGLIRGDRVAGGPDAVWFSAGPGGEAHGLLGLLQPV